MDMTRSDLENGLIPIRAIHEAARIWYDGEVITIDHHCLAENRLMRGEVPIGLFP